jgi:multidrug efflux pump subunit AcrB
MRNRIRPLLLTSGTTILGVLPLIIVGKGDAAFQTALAFVVFWGILGSLFTALILLPALTAVFPRLIAGPAAEKAVRVK